MKQEPLEEYKFKLEELKPSLPKVYKKIGCPSCGNDVHADHININDKIAKCNHCHVVFPFHEEIASFSNEKKIKQEVIRPEGIDIFHFQDELDFTIKQPFSDFDIIQALALFGLGLFLLILVPAALFKEASFVWPALLLLLSIFPIVSLANRSRHKIYLSIDQQNLTLKWRPKKFNKDQQYAINDIDQLYIKSLSGSTYHDVYMIVNGLEGQKHVKLIPKLNSRSKARYLEQEIEKHLGIVDRKIPEES